MKRILRPILPIDRFGKGDRAVTITVWMAGLVQGFGQAQASASLPFSRAALGLTEGEMSLLLGLTRLGGFIALPLAWYADRHGRRKPFLLSLLLIVVGGAVTGLAFDAWQFGIAQAVLRTGTAAISGLAIVVLAETVSPPVRAYAISFYGAAVSLGSGLALLALPLADDGGEAWRRPYLLIASGLLLMPVLIRRVPETRIYQEATHDRTKWVDLTRGVWKGRFWTIIVVAFFASAYGTFGTSFSTTRLVDHVGLSTGSTVTILLGAGTIGGLGFFLGGRMADAWGRRGTSVLCILGALVGGSLLYTATSPAVIAIAAFASTFSSFAMVPAAGAHRAELFPTSHRSSALTAGSNAATVGAAVGLMVGILTIDRIGLTNTIYVLGAGMLVAALLTLRLPETKGQDLTAVAATDR